MEQKKQKILFLYLKTGGGHLAPAKAVATYLEQNFPNESTPILVDGFEETNKTIRYIVEDGYRKLQSKAKWYYEFLYALNKIPLIAKLNTSLASINTKPFLKKIFLKEMPDKIVILHFFLIQPVFKVLKKNNLNIPTITIITDPFTAHLMWFMQRGQTFIAFSERLKNHIVDRLPDSKVHIFPIILDSKFSRLIPAENIDKIKKDLNLPVDKKIVLILGGGDGIPKGKNILKELLKANLNAEIVMVCGKNKSLQNAAEKLKSKFKSDNLIIYGYVDFIYELVNASYTVITKCGASTMMEILMLQKVPVVNDYIWEQEKGNKEFLVDNNLGIYEPDIKKLPAVINKLINDENFYSFYKNNIIKKDLKNGTPDVAKFLIHNHKI
jgi:UDP-N-acetylglucosamine:LPS N-acetylglucosamine transferase